MKGLLAVLVLLGVLVVAAVVGDRVAVGVAQDRLADEVRRAAPGAQVDVALETPFLPQFLRGRYDRVEVSLSGPLQGVEVERATLRLRDVEVPPSDALSGEVQRVPVRVLELRARLGYDELSRLAPQGLTVGPGPAGLVRVTGRVEVLGQGLSAVALTDLSVRDGRLVAVPTSFETGVGLADGLLERVAADRFTFDVDPGPLPLGLVPQGVVAGPDGVDLRARSGPTVLDAGSLPGAGALAPA